MCKENIFINTYDHGKRKIMKMKVTSLGDYPMVERNVQRRR